MRKKLNLVLREPVKLHQTEETITQLPSPFEEFRAESAENKTIIKQITNEQPKLENKPIKPKAVLVKSVTKSEDLRAKMPPRVLQIWEFFCRRANEEGDLKNSFEVTRGEVMQEANIGSTNTYRDALRKFKELGLVEVELRPGVNSGSIFHLTKLGIEQINKYENFE